MNDEIQAEGSGVRPGQRIAKVMARAGVCSRREAEAWIAEGRVAVNGEVLKSPAFNVSETDNVRVDGKPLAEPERTRLFLFHKPRGLVTTARDPEGRNTVFAVLPPDLPRVVAIGRLDINTEGLLLLTNDGGLARVLELPSTGWLRRYRVRAHGIIDQAALDQLADGVTIDGVDYMGVEAKLDREQGSNAWLTLGLREGKNREIKKILEHLGLAVNRLIRVSFGPFELGDLPESEVMEVRTRVLRDQLGVKLAKEANVDFEVPQTIAIEALPPERQGERPRTRSGAARENRGPKRAMPGRFDRGARGSEKRFEGDAAPRRTPPQPSTPERRRKHISALRAEIAADAATTRKRVQRSATHDRKGRTIAVERMSRAGEDATHAVSEARPKGGGRPKAGERAGRSFESGGRAGRGDSFGPKRGRAAAGRERPPYSNRKEGLDRPERSSAGRAEGGPRERRSDRPPARSDGDRRDHAPRTRSAGDPARERKFDRPPDRSRPSASEGRPPRSDDRSSGPRERRFDRSATKGDGDRRDGSSRTRNAGDPARERKFDRPQGRARLPAGEGRPARSENKSRGPRSDFKSRPPRTGARDGDRPQSPGRGAGGKGGPARGRSSPEGRPRTPGKGPPKSGGGSRRPPRKP
jgi:23S rRNA pseudouridine2605 synthase